MDKDRVAEILTEIGTLLELKGENPFKTRAYENAARTLESLTEPLEKLIAENRLSEIKGIGEGIQKKITELVSTGKLAYYDDLKASVPPGLVEMLQIPGLGPKKVKALNDKLGIETIEQLEAACQAGKIAGLDGFGDKTQSKILEGIQFKRAYASRHLLSDALTVAEPVLESLRGHPDVIRCSTAGSVRRFKEIIGDIDFLVSSKKPANVIEFFTSRPGVMMSMAKRRASSRPSGMSSSGSTAPCTPIGQRSPAPRASRSMFQTPQRFGTTAMGKIITCSSATGRLKMERPIVNPVTATRRNGVGTAMPAM